MIYIAIFDHKEGIPYLVKGFTNASKIVGVSIRTLQRWNEANPYKHYKEYTIIFSNELTLSNRGGTRKHL